MKVLKQKLVSFFGLSAFVFVLAFLIFQMEVLSQQQQQSSKKTEAEKLRAGKNFIETKVYTAKEDMEILTYFEGLRVADVSDGMDKVGLTNVGLMSPEIHALWKDTKHFKHRIIGVADRKSVV